MHDFLLLFSKTIGLLWLIGFFIIVVIWAYSPKRKKAHRHAALSIFSEEARDEK
jgi:cytochrome c oxidase cbb3-type subunit 4